MPDTTNPQPTRYRKRPIEVDTIQWTGDNEADVQAFCGPGLFLADATAADDASEATATVYDRLHSTWVGVYTGQHIVRGVQGEYYPIAEDVLAATYESAAGALHSSAEETVDRVTALYEQWVKAGVPPFGASLARWWDARLAEMRAAILPPEPQPAAPVPPSAPTDRAPAERLSRVHEWVTGEVVTAKTEFGNGYRAAQRDIRDLIKGRFDNDAANELRRLAVEAPAPNRPGGETQQGEAEVVAYRDPNSPKTLLCRYHGERWQGVVPVTAEELPDGGICTFGRLSSLECGRDVLIPQPAKEA